MANNYTNPLEAIGEKAMQNIVRETGFENADLRDVVAAFSVYQVRENRAIFGGPNTIIIRISKKTAVAIAGTGLTGMGGLLALLGKASGVWF